MILNDVTQKFLREYWLWIKPCKSGLESLQQCLIMTNWKRKAEKKTHRIILDQATAFYSCSLPIERLRILLNNTYVVSCTHTRTYALILRGRVVASDEMKSYTWYTHTRTECSRWPCEVLLRTEWRVRRDTRTRALIVRVGLVMFCFGQNEELDAIRAHVRWMFALALWGPASYRMKS
jgi:hypothetical protein